MEMNTDDFNAPVPSPKKKWPWVVGIVVMVILVAILVVVFWPRGGKSGTVKPALGSAPMPAVCVKAANPADCQLNVVASAAAKANLPDDCLALPAVSQRDSCYLVVGIVAHNPSACSEIQNPQLKQTCQTGAKPSATK